MRAGAGYLVAASETAKRTLRQAQRDRAHVQSRGQGVFGAEVDYEQWEELREEWIPRRGLIPLGGAEATVRVRASLLDKAAWEEEWDDGEEKHFNGKQKKAVFAGLKEVAKKERRRLGVVSEVYSPPRVSKEAEGKGWTAGTCYDLVTGWDLRSADDRKAMWRRLREEDPDLVVVCPPCTAFSMLQELNYPKMSVEKGVALIMTGLEHLELGAKVAEWQHGRGKIFFFEQPAGARSWGESCIRRMVSLPGVLKVECDMCAYGMNVDGRGLNKKPTGIATNGAHIAKRMSKRCSGDHVHQPLMSGRPRMAQEYPRKFCLEIIRGLEEDLGGKWMLAVEEEETPDTVVVDPDLEGEGDGGNSEATPREQAAVLKLHKGLGHPQLGDFIRFMKAARIRGEIIRWTYRSFRCEACEAKPNPKPSRLATVPRTYQPNKVLGIDLFYVPGRQARYQC